MHLNFFRGRTDVFSRLHERVETICRGSFILPHNQDHVEGKMEHKKKKKIVSFLISHGTLPGTETNSCLGVGS